MKKKLGLLIVVIIIASYNQVFSQCTYTSCNGSYAVSGANTLGSNNNVLGLGSIAIGSDIHISEEDMNSIAIGGMIEVGGAYSFVIGTGGMALDGKRLTNTYPETLMIGFNSTKPTFFVSSSETNTTFDRTGQIGIGNITSPLQKLHLKADEEEIAAMFIEPYNWDSSKKTNSCEISVNGAYLFLGNTNHSIGATADLGLLFNSESNYIFNEGNIGMGVEEPKTKLHINGDILLENDFDGIIMKSPNGQCWKGSINNDGELAFINVDCDNLSGVREKQEHSQVFIYPNPASNKITVEYTGDKSNIRIELRTINSTLISTHKIQQGENTIILNNTPSQMIIANIFDTEGNLIASEKVMIQN